MRCLVLFWFFIVLILAIRDIGTSQHLRIIKGVDRGSVARFVDR